MTNDISVFEAIHTARALRRFKPDPIPDQLIAKYLMLRSARPLLAMARTGCSSS
jgi:nitroreductase